MYHQPFTLESGRTVAELHLAYTTLGQLDAGKSNVVWVFHALTANSNPLEWWPGLVGAGQLLDPEKYFIVCVNMPGSCYGSICPLDRDHATGKPFYYNFPEFTTRDMIRLYQLVKQELGINKIHIGIGGSMGGQQLLEWAIEEPDLFELIIPIATNAEHSPWGVAFNASQRWCIENDPTWKEEHKDAGLEGMKTARSVAMLSYRQYESYFKTKLGGKDEISGASDLKPLFNAETYQRYQGEKLAKRFNAYSYYFLSKSMDNHNVGRGRGSVHTALQCIKARTMVISISSDLLFPEVEQKFIANCIEGAELKTINSLYGHDGFLLEFEAIELLVKEFIQRNSSPEGMAGKVSLQLGNE